MLNNGTIIADRYEILEIVGAGGMSSVYKALDHRLNRYVAIKILKAEFSNDKTFVNKFRIEAQSAAGLSHQNIVNVYDVGDDDGIHYIVMELVEGITLKEYIEKKGHLSVNEAVNFALQIASGIEVAHDNHIIHRDIKSQNIIVSPNGILKVTDFGIAKAASSATVSSNAIGSVHYISPEQARGGYSDERSDIYSLGVTMYEMVTGRVPFQGENNIAVALMHIQDEMVPPREYYPEILPSMEKVIDKCTQKKPERRYLTANALIADLRRVETDPMGEFVHLNALLDDSPTVMLKDDEVNKIKEQARNTDLKKKQENLVKPEQKQEDQDDEEEEKLDPKTEKMVIVLSVVTAVVVVMLILFGVGKAMGLFGSSKSHKKTSSTTTEASATTEEVKEIKVPDVTKKTLDEAKRMLEDEELTYKISYEESDTVEKDTVISQTPNGGDTIKSNEQVELVVSSGTEAIEVPDVRKLDDTKATQIIEENGFKVKHAYAYDDDIEEGKVIKQDPEAGSKAAKGTTITITVSQGKEEKEVSMPNLKGKSLEAAEAALKKLGLELGTVSQSYSSKYAKGRVMEQSYDKGEKLKTGTKVDITISNGEQKTTTYVGKVQIQNPLGDLESGTLRLVLVQNGQSKDVYNATVSKTDFPMSSIEVQGFGEGVGKIEVYVNGTKVPGSYAVTFSAVTK